MVVLLARVAVVASLSVTPQEGSVLRWDGGVSPTDAAPPTEVIPSTYAAVVPEVIPSTEAPTTQFIPTDPTSCRSIQAGVGDSWCIATCTKACPPSLCRCEGAFEAVDAPQREAVVAPPAAMGGANGIAVNPMAEDPSKPTNLDPGSPEYLCKVHGKCNIKTGVVGEVGDSAEDPVSPVPESAKSYAEATAAAGLPNPENMNPSSEEFMCKIHGQCNATSIKPLPNATTIAAECRAQSVCRCKIFGVCQGTLTTEPNDKYPLHHSAHYCKFYALCANDLPEHLRGPEWRSSSSIMPPSTQPQAPKAAVKPAEPSKEMQPETSPAVVPAKVPVVVPAAVPATPSTAAIGEMPIEPVVIPAAPIAPVVVPAAPIAPVVVPAAGQPLPAIAPAAQPLGTPMGGAQAAHWGEQGGVPITVVPMGEKEAATAVAPAQVQPAGVGSDIPGALPIAPLATESSSAELPFRPDDASTCVSVSASTTDDWCQNTCAKSCPPQICTCEGERKPVKITNKDGTPYIGSAAAEAVPTMGATFPVVSPPPLSTAPAPQLTAKDSTSCISVSTSVTDEWCTQSCGTQCLASMCACDEAATEAAAARKAATSEAFADGKPASPFATEEAPRYENGSPKAPEWVADTRNFVGGDLSCASIDAGVSDSWCQLNCATASAHPEVSCPDNLCDCSEGAAQAGEAKASENMDNWKEAEARIRSVDPEQSYPDGLPPADDDKQLAVPAGVPKDVQSCKAVAAPTSDRWCRQICSTGVCPEDKCRCDGGNSAMANWNAAEDNLKDGSAAGKVPSRDETQAAWTAAEDKVKSAWPAGVHGPDTGSDQAVPATSAQAAAAEQLAVVTQQKRAADQAAEAERKAFAAAP